MKLQIGIDGKNYEVDVEVLEEDSSPRAREIVPRSSLTHEPSVRTPVGVRPSRDNYADDSKICRSPVAGVVLRISVQPGQKVQVNDVILVLEAMKMETNVAALAAGTVKALLVQPGDAVKLGQVLAELE